MPAQLNDDAFGLLEFDWRWKRPYSITLFGADYDCELSVDTEEDEGAIDPEQRSAFMEFESRKAQMLKEAEDAIFEYYVQNIDEFRELADDKADEVAPFIQYKNELAKLVTVGDLVFRIVFSSGKMTYGLRLLCAWDIEQGIAVKWSNMNNEIEVSTQDILL